MLLSQVESVMFFIMDDSSLKLAEVCAVHGAPELCAAKPERRGQIRGKTLGEIDGLGQNGPKDEMWLLEVVTLVLFVGPFSKMCTCVLYKCCK